MRRTACVDLPALPLQRLLRRHPDWRVHPVAVIDQDRPQGKLLWVNDRARTLGILPGMRYAAALSLAGGLRAGVMPPGEIERAVVSLTRLLCRHTPHVEPARDDPGTFWLDASGLERLHDSLGQWAGLVRADLERAGFRGTVVVGFSRFGSYALARAGRGVRVLRSPGDEQAAARRVPLDRLAIEPETRDTLAKLGVTTVGDFAKLPPEGIARRFGKPAERLHRLAGGDLAEPLQPEAPPPPALRRQALDHPETSVARLMFVIERLLPSLLGMLAGRGRALTGIQLGFCFERLGDHIERIRPAAPTLDGEQLLELIRLRLEAIRKLPDGVVEVVLAAESVEATREQLRLFAERPRRDLAAANRALARLRAELGNDSVTRARVREGHLPEASFRWEPVDELPAPHPREVDRGTLVRRIFDRPLPLPARPRHEPDGWMLRGLEQGPVVRVLGPYVVSGGWWNRTVHREYHFAETRRGELLWVYYDRPRRRWYLHGRVE